MQKKFYLPLLVTTCSLVFSSISPFTILKAETISATQNADTQSEYLIPWEGLIPREGLIPWESDMDASWLDPSKPIIALTFDDGPVWSGSSASNILDTLEAYNAHATFFYCGTNINDTTQAEIQRSYALGNEIGNHTTDHLDLTAFDASKILYEVNSTADLLSDITGLNHFLVRTPYCSSNETIFNTIPVPLISACIDSQDYNGADVQTIIDRVLTQADDGAIVLMHETLATTGEAVKTIVPELIKRGYQIASVSEMMQAKGITLTSGKMYTYAPIPESLTTSLDGADITYKVTSQWPGNYMGEISITNTGDKALSNWALTFDFADTFEAIYGATLKSNIDGRNTITPGQWNQTIQPGQTGTFSFCAKTSKSIPKFPANLTLTLEDGTVIDTPVDNNNGNASDNNSGNTSDNNGNASDNNSNTSDNNSGNTSDNNGNTSDDNEKTDSALTVSSDLNSWGTGYTCTMTVSNPSDTPVNTWTVKLLKADFQITNYWNCTVTEEGDYLLITPAPYNAAISAGSSTQFGFQGTGTVSPNFTATIS